MMRTRFQFLAAALALCFPLTACAPTLNARTGDSSQADGSALDSMPSVSVPDNPVPDVNIPDVSVEKPDIDIPDVSVPDAPDFGQGSADSQTASTSLAGSDGERITDASGDFVYEGKLQQIGCDEDGYIQVPLGYLPFQDEDVEGLTQYCDVTGKNIVTLDHYDGTDYQTAANNLRAYMETQDDLEGLSGAQVTLDDSPALQLYGHYNDGYFIVCYLIEDAADPTSSYYLALEFDTEHQYLMACTSTFCSTETYHASH